MSVILHHGRFLVREALSPWIKEGRFYPLPIPKGFELEDGQEIVFPAELRCQITDQVEPHALFRPNESRIILSAGWLCQRWCSAFLLLNRCEPDTQLDRDLEVIDLEGNFIWPEYIPMPDSGGELVRKTNSVFAWLFQATITHELGHVILPPKADRLDTEYACDAFAAQWLLQTAADGKVSDKVVMLALTSWMCCICSEGLRGSSWTSNRIQVQFGAPCECSNKHCLIMTSSARPCGCWLQLILLGSLAFKTALGRTRSLMVTSLPSKTRSTY